MATTTPQLEYWTECLAGAAEEVDLEMTTEQLQALAEAAMLGHETYGMAFYSPPPGDHYKPEIERLKRELDKERSMVQCKACGGSGLEIVNWLDRQSISQCDRCRGRGRHLPR